MAPKKSDLRKVTCPGCGLVYWTNRATDLCMDCEKAGVQLAPARQGAPAVGSKMESEGKASV